MSGAKRLVGRAALLLGWALGTAILTASILAAVAAVDLNRRNEANRAATEWLEARLAELRQQAEDAAEQVNVFRRSIRDTGPVITLEDLNHRYIAAKSRRVELEGRLIAEGEDRAAARAELDAALAEEAAARTDVDRASFATGPRFPSSELIQLEREAQSFRSLYVSFNRRFEELRRQESDRASYVFRQPWLIGLVAFVAASGLAIAWHMVFRPDRRDSRVL